jgi:TRAP-type C4-dicarboxylate transport system substrate-binding protein
MFRHLTRSLFFFGLMTTAFGQTIEFKLGTLAPERSPWHMVLLRIGSSWQQISKGGVKLTVYAGGTQGDEQDMVSKMRVGGLHAALITGAGMAVIERGVFCLQVPMMFDSYEELDAVRERLAPELEQLLDKAGFVVLNWGDGGWVHFFSTREGKRLADFRQMKLFTWAGDDEETEQWRAAGFHPVPLAAPDILMSLKSKRLEAVPTTPLFAEWNQVYREARYMNDIKWAPLIGATLVYKKAWERLPLALRDPLLKAAREAGKDLRNSIRQMDDDAVDAMSKAAGQSKLVVFHSDAQAVAEWRTEAEKVYPKLRGKMFPEALFDKVQKLRDEYRAGAAAKASGRK